MSPPPLLPSAPLPPPLPLSPPPSTSHLSPLTSSPLFSLCRLVRCSPCGFQSCCWFPHTHTRPARPLCHSPSPSSHPLLFPAHPLCLCTLYFPRSPPSSRLSAPPLAAFSARFSVRFLLSSRWKTPRTRETQSEEGRGRRSTPRGRKAAGKALEQPTLVPFLRSHKTPGTPPFFLRLSSRAECNLFCCCKMTSRIVRRRKTGGDARAPGREGEEDASDRARPAVSQPPRAPPRRPTQPEALPPPGDSLSPLSLSPAPPLLRRPVRPPGRARARPGARTLFSPTPPQPARRPSRRLLRLFSRRAFVRKAVAVANRRLLLSPGRPSAWFARPEGLLHAAGPPPSFGRMSGQGKVRDALVSTFVDFCQWFRRRGDAQRGRRWRHRGDGGQA